MKITFFITLFLIASSVSSQQWLEEYYQYDNYSKLLKGYYNRGLYNNASNYVDSLSNNENLNLSDYFLFARVYSLNNQPEKSLKFLKIAIKKGITKEKIDNLYDMDKFRASRFNMMYELNYNQWHQEFLS